MSVGLRIIAVKEGMANSAEITAAYTLYTYVPVDPNPQPGGIGGNPVQPGGSTNNNNSNSSNSNTSGGENSTVTQPSIPVVTTRPETVVTGETASAVITGSEAEQLVEQAVSGGSTTVVIAPVVTGNVGRTEVSLPAATASAIASGTSAALTVETPVAAVTIPNGGLANLGSQGGEIVVSAEQTGNGVTVEITANGSRVETVSGGIRAAIPTPCGPGTVARIVDEDGNVISTVRASCASGDGQTMNVPLSGSARVVFEDAGRSFSDVPSGNWAANAVAFASSHELMNGVSETSFSPSEPMTRGMLAVVLHNLEGNPNAAYSGGFGDVQSGAWYAEAVQWAADQGIINGVSAGSFAPGDSITREQLVVMLYRYVGEPAVSGSASSGFSDASSVSGWAQQAMEWAVANGIVKGSGGALNPQGSATRAEVAQMLMNFVSSGLL